MYIIKLTLALLGIYFLITSRVHSRPEKVNLTTHNLCPYWCFEDQNSKDLNKLKGSVIRVVNCVLASMHIQL